ncbi:MAG: immunoglobulin-like domain-containing protein, partial [Peptostreptococcaceae bacterium]
MSKLKSSVKTAVVSTIALTSTAAIIYAVPKIIETQSSDIGNKLKLDVEKIDSDTVKVSIDNVQDIPKSIQFSIKLAGDVELNDGESSIRDLITPEVKTRLANNEYKEESNDILADYTYNQESNTIDVLITSHNSLPKTGNKIEVLELDVKSLGRNSGTTYQVVPSNEEEYKYLSITNKEYSNLGVVSDNEVITMNTAPTITASKDFIKILEGEVLELNAQNLGITMEDKDGDEVKLEVKDLSQSSKPVITEFSKKTPGVYSIECVAIDSNKESSAPVVLQVYVDYDNITELPTITKNGEPLKSTITINGGDIFKPLENVVAVDAKGRELEVQVSSDKELNLDPENDTTYVLTYRAIDSYGNEAIVEVNLKVIANKAPVISGVKNHTLKVGDKFDPREGVTVIDEDDDIELIIESNVNTNIPGEYKVSYSATDSGSKTTRVQSKVVVNERMSSINNIPVITAQDVIIKIGDNFNPLDKVSAYDKEDGDLTSKVKVLENNVDTKAEGTYTVKYSVSDSKGSTATKIINVTVVKDVILANSITINNKFENIYLGASKEINAVVNKEADLKDVEWSISDSSTASIEVKGNSAIITSKAVGKVVVTASTVDGSNLSDSFEIVVSDYKNDNSIPEDIKDFIDTNIVIPISGNGSITSPVELEVKDVEVEDFESFIKNLKKLKPIIVNTVENDKFTSYKIKLTKSRLFSKSNEYYIDLKIDNSLVNASKYKEIINKISNHAPVINIEGLITTIKVGEKFDPLQGVTAEDYKGEDITSKIKVTGKVDTSKVGQYELTYSVSDEDGSTSSVTVVINVLENETPSNPDTTPGGDDSSNNGSDGNSNGGNTSGGDDSSNNGSNGSSNGENISGGNDSSNNQSNGNNEDNKKDESVNDSTEEILEEETTEGNNDKSEEVVVTDSKVENAESK